MNTGLMAGMVQDKICLGDCCRQSGTNPSHKHMYLRRTIQRLPIDLLLMLEIHAIYVENPTTIRIHVDIQDQFSVVYALSQVTNKKFALLSTRDVAKKRVPVFVIYTRTPVMYKPYLEL